MKITMYELLGMVKDGKAPKIIKYKGTLYEYDSDSGNEFYYNDGWSLYREFFQNGNCLNDEVEILEEEKKIPEEEKKIPEKLKDIIKDGCIEAPSKFILMAKINEIIDYLEYRKSKGDE